MKRAPFPAPKERRFRLSRAPFPAPRLPYSLISPLFENNNEGESVKTIRLIWDAEIGKHVREGERSSPVRKGQFIPPIPAGWFRAAGHASGQALFVGAIIRLEAAKRYAKQVKLTGRMTESFGISPTSRRRALAALEAAGLIQIERRHGSSPVVTVIERE